MMSNEAFQFLQLADLRLELPCGGLSEVPDAFRETLLDAPFRAFERTIELGIEQQVDFVVLSGQTCDVLRSGPRAALFLEQQLQRLTDKNIPLYWAAGPRDPVWDEGLDVNWPKNIRVFPRTHAETVMFERHGVPVARLVGRSGEASAWHLNDHVITESPVFTIGLGLLPPAQPDGKRWDVDYWCLHGGATANKAQPLPEVQDVWFHDCGTPQGRNFNETGIYGCSLVTISEERKVRIRECAADCVRYLEENISLPSHLERKGFEAAIRKRAESLHEQNPTVISLVRFTIDCDGERLPPLVWEQWLPEITAQLRRDLGGGNSPLWTTELRLLPSTIPAALLDNEGLLGDFLRSLNAQHEANNEQRLSAETLGLTGPVAVSLGAYLDWNQPAIRRQTLQEAAWLGTRLLGTEEVVG